MECQGRFLQKKMSNIEAFDSCKQFGTFKKHIKNIHPNKVIFYHIEPRSFQVMEPIFPFQLFTYRHCGANRRGPQYTLIIPYFLSILGASRSGRNGGGSGGQSGDQRRQNGRTAPSGPLAGLPPESGEHRVPRRP